MSTPPSLLNIPEVCLKQILENGDVSSMQVLRKVYRDLRNFIDDVKPEILLKIIEIDVRDDKIIVLYDGFEVEYQKIDNDKCQISCRNHQKILENSKFQKVFSKDLELILQNQQKSTLTKFRLIWRGYEPHGYSEVLEDVEKILKSRNRLLRTKELFLDVFEQKNILSVLPYLDSNALKIFGIADPTGENQELKSLEFGEVLKLEQFKKAEEVCTSTFEIDAGISNFLSFRKIQTVFNTVKMEDLIRIKENFLMSTTIPKNFDVYYFNFDDEQQFLDFLGPPLEILDNREKRWFFRLNKSENYCLEIIHYDVVGNVIFHHIQISEVPQNAIIQR